MQYGHFDDTRREYVISTPSTPLPWINYLGSEDFLGMIPDDRSGYTVRRKFRSTEYIITIRRTGERAMTVDGSPA